LTITLSLLSIGLILWFLPLPLSDLNLFDLEGSQSLRVIFFLRLPRVLIALATGATLASSGAAVQGVFQNDLASPELLGITGGASVGALIAFQWSRFGEYYLWVPLAALIGGLLTSLLVTSLNSKSRSISPSRDLIIKGLAISGILSSIVALLLFLSKEQEVRQYLFWMMGSLENRRWEHFLLALPLQIFVLFWLFFHRKELDYFALGYWGARGVGFPWESRRKMFLIMAALGTSASVAATGALGFIGLLVPHAARLWVGPQSKVLIPTSMVLGSALLVLADQSSQVLFYPSSFPVGLLLSLVGGVLFFLLAGRSKNV